MMLLITNEVYEEQKLLNLVQDLNLNGIKLAIDLTQAMTVIENQKNHIDLIIISSVVLDEVKYTLKEISIFSNFFSGPILAKVDDEKFGIELMRESLVNDFYLACPQDKVLEFERLKKAFRVAMLRSRVSNSILNIQNSIANIERVVVVNKDTIDSIQKVVRVNKDSVVEIANKDNIQFNIKVVVNNDKIKLSIEEIEKE